jgi:predicted nucleic acid-binding protein
MWCVGCETPQALQFVSVLSLGEIEKGIGLLALGRRREQLENWFGGELREWFGGRVLPIDLIVTHHWARIMIAGVQNGRPIPVVDGLLAATAIANDLIMVARNVRDFEGTGVAIHNPWMDDQGSRD